MKIGLNLLYLLPGEVGGTETYAISLIHAISKIDQENTYYIYLNRESSNIDLPTSSNFISVHCKVNATNRFFRFFWEQLILPWQVRHLRLDLLHSLGYVSPLFLSCRSVVTVHDLNYKFVPQSMSAITRLAQRLSVEASTRFVDHVIVVSNFVRNQVINFLKIAPHKVSTIHEAPKFKTDQIITPLEPSFREKYGISKPYIVAFSSLTPHKNITGLIRAFQRICHLAPDRYQLVIIGHRPRNNIPMRNLEQQLESLNERVVFTGYVSDSEIFMLLANSSVFVFPSLYEGFGLPLLEAMSAGVPVVCSNRGSLPEVAGEAALFFDPENIMEMADQILRVVEGVELRKDLINKGKLNLTRFSWEKAAGETLNVYRSMVGEVL